MAKSLVGIDDAAAQLNMTRDQLADLAKKRKLRSFNDQGVLKFKQADIDAFRKQTESGATMMVDSSEDDGSSGVDVGGATVIVPDDDSSSRLEVGPDDIEIVSAEEESSDGVQVAADQVSALEEPAPAVESPKDEESSHVDLGAIEDDAKAEDSKEVTEFSMEVVEESATDRIDLEDVDAEPGADESDQTSVLPVTDDGSGAEEVDEEPVFDFAEDDLGLSLEDEASGSVLVSDDSESSADILDVAEAVEDESSSDTIVPVRDDSDLESAAVADSDVVTDILDTDVEDSDDDLDTIDLDDVAGPVEQMDDSADELITVIEDDAVGSSADTAPLEAYETGEEVETVSLEEAEAVTEDVSGGLGDYEEEGVDSGPAAEDYGEVEATAPMGGGYAAPMPMADYLPSAPMNFVMAASIVLGAVGGFMMVCELTGATANPVVQFIRQEIVEKFFASL